MEEGTRGSESSTNSHAAKFGAFELRLDTGELRKHGVRVRLQGKPFQILRALIQRPGHVVTREELRVQLWSSDTFVDFESGLNTAVNRLRVALGDSAENPIYVETLARIGYRFIAPLRIDVPASALEPLKDPAPAPAPLQSQERPAEVSRRFAGKRFLAISGLVVLIVLVTTAAALKISFSRSTPSFHQITFMRGSVENARFIGDGKEILYSAEWNAEPSRLFRAQPDAPESKNLGFEGSYLASVSPKGEVALFESADGAGKYTLESVALGSGAHHVISDRAKDADWSRNGSLCLVTMEDSVYSVEYPAGHKLYTSNGWITNVRVSPSGSKVAFLEHPISEDDGGQVVIVDSSGRSRVLSSSWGSVLGLAWHPSKDEIWFTAARSGVDRALMAVDLSGRARQIAQIPGGMELLDIGPSGEVLIARTTPHMTMLLGNLKRTSTRDISLLDWSRAAGISQDGKRILFDESGEGGGKQYSVYLYNTDTRSAKRIGEGRAMDLSSDGRWALSQAADDPSKLFLLDTTQATTTPLSKRGFEYRWVKFLRPFPCTEILFEGNRQGEKTQIYKQELPDGDPVLVQTGLQLYGGVVDQSGVFAAGSSGPQGIAVLDLSNGTTRTIRTARPVSPVQFLNPNEILTRRHDKGGIVLELLDLRTAQLNPYKRLDSANVAGTLEIFPIYVARDLQTFVYSRLNCLSDLYAVKGWN